MITRLTQLANVVVDAATDPNLTPSERALARRLHSATFGPQAATAKPAASVPSAAKPARTAAELRWAAHVLNEQEAAAKAAERGAADRLAQMKADAQLTIQLGYGFRSFEQIDHARRTLDALSVPAPDDLRLAEMRARGQTIAGSNRTVHDATIAGLRGKVA